MRKKIIKVVAVFSACIIAIYGSVFAVSAASYNMQDVFKISEAVLYKCEDNGTLTSRVGGLDYSKYNSTYDLVELKYDNSSGSIVRGFYTTVLGGNLETKYSKYSMTVDVIFIYPVYISWAAIQDKNGVAIRAKSTPLYENDLSGDYSLIGMLSPNSDGVYGYRFTFPAAEYNGYLMFHLVSNVTPTWNAPSVINWYANFNFEFYYDEVDNSVIGDLDDKTNEALGGKSEEQIQEEIDSALEFDTDSIDFNSAMKLSSLFDDLLSAFGEKYQALLLLSLTLGLSAFLIGKRWA